MTPTERIAATLLKVIGWVVALGSGAFMLLYLYRWEWNRALICGLFFVASELALVATAILRRLRRIEQRLDALDDVAVRPPATDPQPSEEPREGPFAWLTENQGADVFVPVLLGVGVIISAIAWVVERIAGAAWSPGGDAAAERRLRGIMPTTTRTRRPVATWLGAVVAAVFLVFSAVYGLSELTMYRPDPFIDGGSTSYELSVEIRSGERPDPSIVQTLWLSCRAVVPGRTATIETLTQGRFQLRVEPLVGRNDDRRLTGCLEDIRLDRILVAVLGSDDQPTRSALTRAAPAWRPAAWAPRAPR